MYPTWIHHPTQAKLVPSFLEHEAAQAPTPGWTDTPFQPAVAPSSVPAAPASAVGGGCILHERIAVLEQQVATLLGDKPAAKVPPGGKPKLSTKAPSSGSGKAARAAELAERKAAVDGIGD